VLPPTSLFIFGLRGLELQGLMLARQTLYHLSLELLYEPCFVLGIFEIVSSTICPGWLQTLILLISLISASQVARITGVHHQRLAIAASF
jgi:hypothetical protein